MNHLNLSRSQQNSLPDARIRKEAKYEDAIFRWKRLVKTMYRKEIKQTYKVDGIKMKTFYITISSLGLMLQKRNQICLNCFDGKGKNQENNVSFG
jgi:hypothetical protein